MKNEVATAIFNSIRNKMSTRGRGRGTGGRGGRSPMPSYRSVPSPSPSSGSRGAWRGGGSGSGGGRGGRGGGRGHVSPARGGFGRGRGDTNYHGGGDAVFGSDDEAVAHSLEHHNVYKVGPADGQRYFRMDAFLRGVSAFIAWKTGGSSSAHENEEEEDEEDDEAEVSSGACRRWWPDLISGLLSPAALPRNAVFERKPQDQGPLRLSLRLEHLDVSDDDVALLAAWAQALPPSSCCIAKLWLYDNPRLSDNGAAAVARILTAHPALAELHLSHTAIGVGGAAAVLAAVPADDARLAAGPLWLRLEWCRVSIQGLVQELEAQHASRGLLVDLPAPRRLDAATRPLHRLPAYLEEAAAAVASKGVPRRASLPPGRHNTLDFLLERAHARLPWVSSQRETPAEASVLRKARAAIQPRLAPQHAMTSSSTTSSRGPLLLVVDTSALLAMIGVDASMAAPTFFTLQFLLDLSSRNLFGRSLPATEQTFIIVPASVATQLDGLKTQRGAAAAVRRFFGRGLDELGPAGADILTLLAAHEGEALVLEKRADVAGSRDELFLDTKKSRGQRTDHRIVEVALYFQQECTSAAYVSVEKGVAAMTLDEKENDDGDEKEEEAPFMSVVLLTSDHGQARLARAHGLPTVLMADLNARQRELLAPGRIDAAVTATALRAVLTAAGATAGLGGVAPRSLQSEFDGAVAVLRGVFDALEAARRRQALAVEVLRREGGGEGGEGGVAAALDVLTGGDGGGGGEEEAEAVRQKLVEWEGRVRSVQKGSRVLEWSHSAGGMA